MFWGSVCGGKIITGRKAVEHYSAAIEIAIKDFLARADMAQKASVDDIRPLFHDPRMVQLIALDDQYRMVGAAILAFSKHHVTERQDAEIVFIYMRPDRPHAELMKKIDQIMVEVARQHGCEAINGVTSRSDLLDRFATKYGYKAVATIVRKEL